MWMFILMVLPLLAVVYVSWHLWMLLPLSALWKSVVILVGIACFLLLFANFSRKLDALPLSVAQTAYEIGTSSLIIMLYLVMLFLVIDLGRLLHVVPKSLIYHNWASTVALVVLMFGLFLYGNLHYNNKVRVPLELTTDKPLLHYYKIVMASELQLGYHNPRRELARWVVRREGLCTLVTLALHQPDGKEITQAKASRWREFRPPGFASSVRWFNRHTFIFSPVLTPVYMQSQGNALRKQFEDNLTESLEDIMSQLAQKRGLFGTHAPNKTSATAQNYVE